MNRPICRAADDLEVFAYSFSVACQAEVSLDFIVATLKFLIDFFLLDQRLNAQLVHFTVAQLMLHDLLSEFFIDEALLERRVVPVLDMIGRATGQAP